MTDALEQVRAHRERQAHIRAVVHDQRRFIAAWVIASTWVHDTMVVLRGR